MMTIGNILNRIKDRARLTVDANDLDLQAEILIPFAALNPALIRFQAMTILKAHSKPLPIGAEGQTCESPTWVRFECPPHAQGRREFEFRMVAFE